MRSLVALSFALSAAVASAARTEVVSKVGGLGQGNVTAAFQREIDALAASGGGTLRIPAGEYVVASLRLRSGITLHLERNAFVYGSTNASEYVNYVNTGDNIASVIQAEEAENVAVEGEGVVDGRGWFHKRVKLGQDGHHYIEQGRNDLYFHNCRGVRVEGVTLRCASSWCCFFRDCDGVVARKVRIWSHMNPSNDGFDIESRNVLIEDCDIDTEDDSLVLKAREPDCLVENVTVRRCRLSTVAEHIKIGTETLGTVRNVLIEDCDVACRTPAHKNAWEHIPGVQATQAALSGISLFLMDGGRVEDVTIRNIALGEGLCTPICIRYGDRKPRLAEGKGYFRNVLIENVKMSVPSVSYVACSVTGLPEMRPQNIVFRNVDLILKGGGRAKDAAVRITEEHPKRYPTPYHVFETMFPAYAFYLRHADNVRFENVRVRVMDPEEARPPVLADDATYEERECQWK